MFKMADGFSFYNGVLGLLNKEKSNPWKMRKNKSFTALEDEK